MDATKGTILNFVNMVDSENKMPETEKDLYSELLSLATEDEKGQQLLGIMTAMLFANLTSSDNTEIAERAKKATAILEMDEEVIQSMIELGELLLEDE